LKAHLTDIGLTNAVALVVSLLSYLMHGNILNTFTAFLFLESGVVFLLGGLFGFLLASSSFNALGRLLGVKNTEGAEIGPKQRRSMGQRLILLGAVLFAETILLTLVAM
jgi:hypothetical protein